MTCMFFFLCCGLFLFLGIEGIRSDFKEQTPLPLPIEKWGGRKIMFIYPHIDDMECSAGGLVASLNGKADIHLLIITNGDKGCSNTEVCGNLTNSALSTLRQQEQLDSAHILGLNTSQIYYLNYEDCLLQTYAKSQVQEEIIAYIRRIQPDVVMTWDPQPRYELIPSEGWGDIGYHPDHQYTGQLVVDSVWTASLDRFSPELGSAWKVLELYFWSYSPQVQPTYFLDLSVEAYRKKVNAFQAMKSQFSDPKEVELILHFLGSQVANTVGLSQDSKAEAYVYVLW